MANATSPIAATAADATFAGFWIRFLAFLVDNVILFLILFVIALGFGFLGPNAAPVLSVLFMLAPIAYWAAMHASAKEATFGKALLGMKVVGSASPGRISILRSIGRELAKIVSALPMLIGFVMAAFTGRKQALHDYISSTVVVRETKGHVVAALAVCVLGFIAPIVLVMSLGVGMFGAMMGGLWGEMKQLQDASKQVQRAAVQAPPSQPPQVQVTAAPAQAAAPAAPPSGAIDAVLAARLDGIEMPGTTRAGPAVLELDLAFSNSLWIKVHLPALKEFEGKPARVVVTRITDAKGGSLFDPANRFESEFFQKVSMREESTPIKHLVGTRNVNLADGANSANFDRAEGTLSLALPVNPVKAAFTGADAGKQQTVHGVPIEFRSLSGDKAEFGLPEDVSRIVSINGFGTDDKPVALRSTNSGGGVHAYGFSGPLSRVELTVAESIATREYPFTLTKASTAGPAR